MTLILALILPIAVFLIFGKLMTTISNRNHVIDVLKNIPRKDDRKPLNMRPGGYDVEAVARHWQAIVDDESGLAIKAEDLFLRLDLVFPLIYGGAFVTSFLMLQQNSNVRFDLLLAIVPVTITVLADWTENLIQINQLNRFEKEGATALQAAAIGVASVATRIKLLFFIGAYVYLLVLTVVAIAG